MLCELFFVALKLFFEAWHIPFGVLVSDFAKMVQVLLLQLVCLVREVLLLGFDDHAELGFFAFHLLNQFFELRDLLEILDFLRRDFLVEHVLLLLRSDAAFHVAAISRDLAEVSFGEKGRQIWVD